MWWIVKLLKDFFALFMRGTSGFNSLETIILRAAESQMPSDYAARLRRRVDQINLVQRLYGAQEINCFQLVGGKPSFDISTSLSPRQGGVCFAKFSFESLRGELFKGELWLADGYFFSIHFDNPTEHVIDEELLNFRLVLESPVTAER